MLKIKIIDVSFKLCIFGSGGVGKTSLVRKYLTGFFDINTQMTLGAEIFVKHLDAEGKSIALQIWDFGGEDKFRFLLPIYAGGSSGGIFMCDITNNKSLEKLEDWLMVFKKGLNEQEKQIPILMVGGKLDLQESRSISREEAIELSKSHNLFDYMECSAKTGENVEKIFQTIAHIMLKNADLI